jgi:hypothetical protein
MVSDLTAKQRMSVKDVAANLIQQMKKKALHFDVILSERENHYLLDLTYRTLIDAISSGIVIEKMLIKSGARALLSSNLGNFLARTMCTAARRNGMDVVGSIHGGNLGIYTQVSTAMLELTPVTKYITGNSSTIELFRKMRDSYPLSRHYKPEISFYGYNSYHKVATNSKNSMIGKSIRSIMIIEYPLTPFHHPSKMLYWDCQLRALVSLGRILREAGLITIIKRHPDRLLESEGLYDTLFDKVMIEPFENVLDQADAFFFPHLSTSTFARGIISEKPVFIFECALDEVWPEPADLLRKRCRVVPSKLTPDGCIHFDKKELTEMIKRPVEKPDNSFFERYIS